jgi:cytochrome c oxidase assembly protein subunit 11
MPEGKARPSHGRLVTKILLVTVAMFGFGYAMVPLYDILCDITGLNGKTGQLAEAEAVAQYQEDVTRWVTVEFIANNNEQMPWELAPVVRRMKVHPGRVYATAYLATNPTGRHMVGQATPSVAPSRGSRYFNKTECFCFTRQPLGAGESKEMPVRFIVDPALPKDISTLTLAYTFFDVTDQAVN